MQQTESAWRVLPHGPLERLADNLWWLSGSLPHMTLRRCMTVARMSDGALVVHSAIALEEHVMEQLEALGTPTYLVIPSAEHKLDAPGYQARYPSLRVFTPRGALEKVRKVVRVDGSYEDFPSDEHVRLEPLHGVNDAEGAMIVRSPDGVTVVLNDVLMNMDRKRDVLGFVFTTLMGSAPGPRVSRLAKLLLVRDKAALRADFDRYASLPELARLVVAHENVAFGRAAKDALERAATYL